jgi:hypothetical protein
LAFWSLQLRFPASQYHLLRYLQQSVKFVHQKYLQHQLENHFNEIAFQNLIHEINDDLVVHKKVFRMTQLLEKYKGYLPADTGTYSSAKLQDRLVKHYAGSIVMHTQQGQ